MCDALFPRNSGSTLKGPNVSSFVIFNVTFDVWGHENKMLQLRGNFYSEKV